jgi:cytochrome c5
VALKARTVMPDDVDRLDRGRRFHEVNMNKKTIAVIGAALLLACMAVIIAQEPDAVEPRILAYDKGPAKIDVSKYPKDMQANYKVFVTKCSKCHTVARAINCEFALDDEWERYVKRMMRKAGTVITADEGKQIFDFVTYDSKTRKKDLYERKLKEAGKVS